MENYPVTPAILLQWYRDYNRRYFDGELPEAALQNFCIRNYKHFGQFHHPRVVRGRMRPWMISETVYYNIDERNRRHTLLHEMCHLWCYVKGFTNEHHGRRWQAIAARVSRLSGFDIRRVHPGSFAVSEAGMQKKARTAERKEKAYPIVVFEYPDRSGVFMDKARGYP